MGKKNLKRYDPAFKARIALEAAKEQESLAQIGLLFSDSSNSRLHPRNLFSTSFSKMK
jgi:transposase-like protein